jgi:gliding motility-associated-like protein
MKHILLFCTTILLIAYHSISQVNLTSGLVAHYTFDGNPNDVSGNNQNGTLKNGIIPGTDRFGNANKAYQFDGIDDYIAVPDNQGLFSTANFSVVVWFKSESDALQNIIGKRDFGVTNGQQYQFFINYPPSPGIGSNIISNLNDCRIGITSLTSYTNSGVPLCSNKWILGVITFDGTFHKIYINGELKKSVATGFTTMANCRSELRFGNWWQGDLIPFKGLMDDIRWYNRAINDAEIKELYKDAPLNITGNSNFSYVQEVCSPSSFQFTSSSSVYNSFEWDFGDLSPIVTEPNPQHIFPGDGDYLVKLISGDGSCADTVKKVVNVKVFKEAIINLADTTICPGTELTLRSDSSAQYCWGPVGNVPVPSISRELKVKPTQKTTYVLNVFKYGTNLIPNGNFEGGNTGFTSDYLYTAVNTGPGQYFVGNRPNAWKTNFCATCGDQTNSNGNLLLINGPLNPNGDIWSTSVNVVPNTPYYFSFWVYSYNGDQLPSFVLNINGEKFGPEQLTARGKWVQIGFFWNSQNFTTAAISLINVNTSTSAGNDFGIDDISLATFKFIQDSITVDIASNVGNLKASPDSAICPGQSVQLSVTGAAQISWSPATGLSNAAIANPVATPAVTTTYIVSDISPGSCVTKDTVVVTVKSKPVINVSNDTTFCSGKPGSTGVPISASGGVSYNWFPATGLNNPNIAAPSASPTVNTDYSVAVTGSNGCHDTGSVKVIVNPFVAVNAADVAPICTGKSVSLQASGAVDYSWFPSQGLSNSNTANPIANPSQTTSYIVFSPTAGLCSGRDTVIVTVNPLPVVTVSPADTTLCLGKTMPLAATGGTQYQWSPATGLDNPASANPIASPAVTTVYSVLVTDANGCSDTRQSQVVVGTTVNLTAAGDAPTCAGNPVAISASGATDYKWFPATGLSADNIPNPVATPAQTTTYYVLSPSAGLCSNVDSVTITVSPLPVVSITPPESLICNGGQVQLNASGGSIYSWSPSTGLSNPASASPTANPTVTTTYSVTVKDASGCESVGQAKIIVAPGGKIFVPNAFTPNGDGLNDCIGIKGALGATTFEFAIYNRWGERVFYATDPTLCWDGVYKGIVQPNGNFAYYLKVSSDCGTVNEKGLITLIK